VAFWVKYKGRPYAVSTWSIDGLRKYIYGESQEGQDFKEEKGLSYRLDIHFANGESRRYREGFLTEDPYVFLGRVTDYVDYTFSHVHFEIDPPSPEGDEQRQNDLKKTALNVVQRLIGVYQEMAGDPDVFSPDEYDSLGVDLLIAERDYTFKEGGSEIKGDFKRVSSTIQWDPLEKAGKAKPSSLPQEWLDKFQNRLEVEEDLPLYIELLLSGKEYAHLHRDYRIAVVMIQSAFEVFLQDRLLEEYKTRGIPHVWVRQGRSGSIKKPIEEAMPSASLQQDLLEKYGKELCGESVKNNPYYER
jgi:hypothetical protein